MELQQLGWNIPTLCFTAILAITLLRGVGFFHQARRVWDERSTASLSVTTFQFFTAAFALSVLYGWTVRSLALMISGAVCGALLLWLQCGVVRAGGYALQNWVVAAGLTVFLVVLCVLGTDQRRQGFVAFAVVCAGIAAHQPYTLWRARSCGVVSGRMITMMLLGASVWVAYGLAVHDAAVVWSTVPYITVYLTTLALWVRYRRAAHERKEQRA